MNSTIQIILLAALLIMITIILILVTLTIRSCISYHREKIKFDRDALILSHTPSDNDFNILDRLIMEALQEYQILKLDTNKYAYVTPDEQKKIFEYVLRKVMYKMSPSYKEKLSLIYNMDNFNEIITDKINIAIINFTIEFNSNINSTSEKNKRDNL